MVMRQLEAFRQFVKAHRGHPVLSVYVGGGLADVAEQHSWLVPLRHALRRAWAAAQESPLAGVAEGDAAAFAACEVEVLAALPEPRAIHDAGAWCAFAAVPAPGDVVLFSAALPRAVPTQVRWQAGAMVLPYLAAAPEGQVLVLQLERDQGRLLRLDGDHVTELVRDAVELELGAAAHMGDTPRQGFHTGTRGETLTDLAQRRLREARQQLLGGLLARTVAALDPAGVLVVGGSEEVGRHALTLLPEGVAARAAWATGLRAPLAEAALVRTARRAAEGVRDAQHQRWLEGIREGAHAAGHGATGGTVVRQALALGAVERLLLSTALTQRDPVGAEAMARDALLQGAAVIVSPNGAGEQLERLAQGAAARLRYPLPAVGVPLSGFTLRAAASAPPIPLSSTPQLPLAGGPA